MKRHYVAMTLVNAAIFVPPLAIGFLNAIDNYAPYLPVMLQVTTMGAAFVFVLLQAVVASVALLKRARLNDFFRVQPSEASSLPVSDLRLLSLFRVGCPQLVRTASSGRQWLAEFGH
ncbi:MAG: hypothetical protein R3C49_26280 [Planctomycetaceae bacterium]